VGNVLVRASAADYAWRFWSQVLISSSDFRYLIYANFEIFRATQTIGCGPLENSCGIHRQTRH
jgi:hypothetical protein